MFPAITLCHFSNNMVWFSTLCCKSDHQRQYIFLYKSQSNTYHLHFFHLKMENFNDNMDKALSENLWNHAEVDFGLWCQKSGIHVLKDKAAWRTFASPTQSMRLTLCYTRNVEGTDIPEAKIHLSACNLIFKDGSVNLSTSTSNEMNCCWTTYIWVWLPRLPIKWKHTAERMYTIWLWVIVVHEYSTKCY